MLPVSDPTIARATVEKEMFRPAARPLKASPALPRLSSACPSSTMVSNISAASFVAVIGAYILLNHITAKPWRLQKAPLLVDRKAVKEQEPNSENRGSVTLPYSM